ncbi:helix-turn-helix domain-containing protein [bacterium]|nr:helix-turn-helix domain-containing protein [bacterium]
MPEYLSKEEIRKWRSSLERITLEEYAARLGKVIQDEKDTDDMVDKVMQHSLNSMSTESYPVRTEEIKSITLRAFRKEKEIVQPKAVKPTVKETPAPKKVQQPKQEKTLKVEIVNNTNEDMPLSFNKALTQREQLIFDHFYANRNKIVYAKDLAKILDLPRDYVYKYIKNLRSKLNEDILHNADNGGYLLKV